MEIKYYGHSCFTIQVSGCTLLFDPFITPNELAKEVNIDDIKPNYILISHAHQDHVYDALELASKNQSTIIGIWEISEWAIKNGHSKTHPMNIGGSWEFEFGKVHMVNAVHSSSFADGSYGGNPVGFVIQFNNNKTVYYSGDTALTLDMQLIPLKHNLDIALLPIGNNFTMDVKDAMIASDFINCNKIIGMHYDTFGYIKIDKEKAQELFKEKNKELILLNINQSLEI